MLLGSQRLSDTRRSRDSQPALSSTAHRFGLLFRNMHTNRLISDRFHHATLNAGLFYLPSPDLPQ